MGQKRLNAKRRRAKEIEEQKAMLRHTVWCVCCGACGEAIETEDYLLMPADLARAIPALKGMFQGEVEAKEDGGSESPPKAFLFAPGNLHHYETVESITNFFFEYGVRA